MITSKDYSANRRKLITIEDLAIRENMSLDAAAKALHSAAPIEGRENRWTPIEKEQLKTALASATSHGEQTAILQYYNIKSQAHALGLLRIPSLDILRYGAQINKHLRRYRLKLSGSTLHSIGRNRRSVDLDSDAIGELVVNPIGWIKANIDTVKYLLKKESHNDDQTRGRSQQG